MVAKGTGRWVYFSFSGGSSPPPAAGSFLPYSPSTIGRKALRFVLLCSRLVKKVLTLALHCSNYCCVAVIIAEWCAGACIPRATLNNRGTLASTRKGGRRYRATRGSVRSLLTLGQPHRNTAIRAHLQIRRSLALLVVLVLCLSAFLLAANEAWAKEQSAKEQPSPAAQQGPAEGKNTPNGQGNGKVGEPVRGTPTPSVTLPPVQGPPAVTPPAFQEQPAVTPPVQKPPVETAPPPPTSETLPPAEKPSSPPLDPAPSTP